MVPDLSDPGIPRLVMTGHPNHELAIFGFVRRTRPHLLFLTDGGGAERVEESRRALDAAGLADRATFLNWPEQALYDALLDRDIATLRKLADVVREHLLAIAPRQVICESIELYNPLHDITLPIVRAAATGLSDIDILEFPLIAQEPSTGEHYRVQRFPRDREMFSITLDSAELDAKLHARDLQYPTLRRSMAGVLDGVSRDSAGTEVFGRAMERIPVPDLDHALRYEWRGRLLQERGDVETVITFADHFVPLTAALANPALE